ncbi:MAG: DUF2139 domain-containing protein [Acidilobaceae archaeon]
MVFEKFLELRPSGYGPEWGSGGIFGLKYCRGTLYYTLAFEAEAHFIEESGESVYRFTALGPGPASGGDTYNAVDCVDDMLFFGGWVHNPAVYKGKVGFKGEIDFRNKFSHVHSYDLRERSVKLLWSDTIRHESKWAGEVSEIIFDPVNSKLLIARGDGHVNLGVYELDPKSGEAGMLSETPSLKGSRFLDYSCFDMQPDWVRGVDGIQCFDLVSRKQIKHVIRDWSSISVDGGGVEFRGSGYAVSAYTRYYHFMRGGFLVGNPVEPELEEPRFVRLLDFGGALYSQLSPQRSNALPAGGGILAPFNAYTHGVLHIDSVDVVRVINRVRGPSVLLYITPPQARIVGVYGARITSMTKMGSKILIAYNTSPNLGGLDSSPIDVGFRGLTAVDEDTLLNRGSPPAAFKFEGIMVGSENFGGIPLSGYKNKKLKISASKSNTLTIYEYDAGLPPSLVSTEKYRVGEGLERVELEGFHGIVSFKLEEPDASSMLYVYLY